MKLLILSDIHNEFSVLPQPETDADVVILAGDIDTQGRGIEWSKGFRQPVLYVAGNHEYYGGHLDTLQQQMKQQAEDSNVTFMENRQVVIDSVRFLGCTLWTDFKLYGDGASVMAKLDAQSAMNDYRVIRIGSEQRRLNPDDTESLFNQSLQFLKTQLALPFDGPTVVITHHAPSFESISEQYKGDLLTPAFASCLDDLMGPQVALWIHGHVHHSNDYRLNGTRVVSNPRGYHSTRALNPENPQFNPTFIVEI